MNHSQIVQDVLTGMDGIGGVPSNQEFYDEFNFRLKAKLGISDTPILCEGFMDKTKVNVYMVDGRVFSYYVDNPVKAREHAHRIVNYGWRNSLGEIMEYYPTHQVLKVTFNAPGDTLDKKYESKSLA